MSDLLTEIYRSHRQGLFSVALAITGSRQQAEDAVHEAFCKLVDRKPPTEDAVPYIFKTVRNAAIPTPRTQQAHQQRAGGGMPDSGHFFVLAFSSSHVRGELWVGVPPKKRIRCDTRERQLLCLWFRRSARHVTRTTRTCPKARRSADCSTRFRLSHSIESQSGEKFTCGHVRTSGRRRRVSGPRLVV